MSEGKITSNKLATNFSDLSGRMWPADRQLNHTALRDFFSFANDRSYIALFSLSWHLHNE
jgi:hypothetical protein